MHNRHRSQFLALIAAASCLTLPGCGGVNSLSDFYEKYIVGTGDQIVHALDNAVSLDIDAGTFNDLVTLLFASLLNIPLSALILVTGIDFQIEQDVDPLKSLLLELLYDPANIPAGFNESDLALWFLKDGIATKLNSATFDFTANKVKAEITEEGQYVVAVENPES
jgi:hypothetical protein